jgi:phosphate transport system substrate-binding protein
MGSGLREASILVARKDMRTKNFIPGAFPNMVVRWAAGVAMILVLGLLTSCQETLPMSGGSVQLKGSETLRSILTMCAEDFMSKRPHIDVMVQGGGTGVGIAALLHGMVNVAMASRELSATEQQYANRQGLQIRTFDLAFDGIAVVVHPDNPVESLPMRELREIFTGARQSW